jgi:hypothetical protein
LENQPTQSERDDNILTKIEKSGYFFLASQESLMEKRRGPILLLKEMSFQARLQEKMSVLILGTTSGNDMRFKELYHLVFIYHPQGDFFYPSYEVIHGSQYVFVY